MKETPTKKMVEPKLKIWLLQGKKITHLEALRMWKTTRLAEYVRQLRNKGMKIKTELVSENGCVHGVYYLDIKKKESRIESREYLNQAYSKTLK